MNGRAMGRQGGYHGLVQRPVAALMKLPRGAQDRAETASGYAISLVRIGTNQVWSARENFNIHTHGRRICGINADRG